MSFDRSKYLCQSLIGRVYRFPSISCPSHFVLFRKNVDFFFLLGNLHFIISSLLLSSTCFCRQFCLTSQLDLCLNLIGRILLQSLLQSVFFFGYVPYFPSVVLRLCACSRKISVLSAVATQFIQYRTFVCWVPVWCITEFARFIIC